MASFEVIAGAIGGGAFAILVGVLLAAPRSHRVGRYLVGAGAVSAIWFGCSALFYAGIGHAFLNVVVLQYLELARDVLWLLFLARLLETVGDPGYRQRVWASTAALIGLCVVTAVCISFPQTVLDLVSTDMARLSKFLLLAFLLVALGALVLTEQLFRNSTRDSRWALKHLCFGLGLIFVYDFYLYADAVLWNRLDSKVWASRGLINAVAVPMLALSASRNRQWQLNIFVSRRVVFHGVTLVAAGGYLMTMAAAGYYLQLFGGEWGRVLRTAFFSAAILGFLSVFFSSQLRSRIRMFLARHFYRNKYEYGEEWLKFTQALSRTKLDPGSLNRTILESVADIVDSPGGIIFQRTAAGTYTVAAALSVYESCQEEVAADAEWLVRLRQDAAVRDLATDTSTGSEAGARLPPWLRELPRVGLLIPIVHGDELLAFLVLARPRSNAPLDWEDLNLLGTVGRQAAGYLALMRATDELAEARQFETFNRLSAFLVHDLKNVVAQLSLIVRNAERHGQNPEFVDDAFRTVGDAVGKMNRMLASLRQMQPETGAQAVVDLSTLAAAAVAARRGQQPVPVLGSAPPGLLVRADRDRLLSVIEHLLQNAIEATDPAGNVDITVQGSDQEVQLAVTDSGCGMDQEFINHRLFKAFDTTKGKAGMGIGAYESRHVVSSMNGRLQVDSTPGEGSVFTIILPRVTPTRETLQDAAEQQ